MTLTLDQAIEAREFHYTGPSNRNPFGLDCSAIIGPRGGIKIQTVVARRSGQTKTWKTRPGEFLVPVKPGMYESTHITDDNAAWWHTSDTCPLVLAPDHAGLDDNDRWRDDTRAGYWRAVLDHIAVCAECRSSRAPATTPQTR